MIKSRIFLLLVFTLFLAVVGILARSAIISNQNGSLLFGLSTVVSASIIAFIALRNNTNTPKTTSLNIHIAYSLILVGITYSLSIAFTDLYLYQVAILFYGSWLAFKIIITGLVGKNRNILNLFSLILIIAGISMFWMLLKEPPISIKSITLVILSGSSSYLLLNSKTLDTFRSGDLKVIAKMNIVFGLVFYFILSKTSTSTIFIFNEFLYALLSGSLLICMGYVWKNFINYKVKLEFSLLAGTLMTMFLGIIILSEKIMIREQSALSLIILGALINLLLIIYNSSNHTQ